MTTVPFRTNWWSHYCPLEKKEVWKHKQYMSCKCGAYNGKTNVTRSTMNVSFTKDELQMLSDALFPFWAKTVIKTNDPEITRTYIGLEKKLEKLLE